jgi:Domain of unknown function (DUF4149)
MLQALAAWVGALIFFPMVAQTAFTNLPPHAAGLIVRGSLLKLHCMGFVCGIVFLASSVIYNRIASGKMQTLSARHVFMAFMLALSAISQFLIIPRMDALRLAVGEISTLPSADPIRAQFDSLHAWSTRIEGTVLVLGVLLLHLTSRRLADHS